MSQSAVVPNRCVFSNRLNSHLVQQYDETVHTVDAYAFLLQSVNHVDFIGFLKRF